MTRGVVYGVIAMALVVVASNILVQHLYGDWLTWGAFTYPFAFLVTDLTNRALGAAAARKVVLGGFAVGVVCSLVASQMVSAEGYPLTTLRIAVGSGLAFLTAQLIDVGVFNRLRSGSWWRAPLVSSFVGSAVDTALFFSIAFSARLAFIDRGDDVAWANEVLPLLGVGPEAALWVSLASADFMVKMGLAMLALVPFRIALGWIRNGRVA